MAFEKLVSWHLVISDSNSHRRLCTLVFADDDKIVELVKHSGGLTNLESKQALERGIDSGRGEVFLKVTPEQYAKVTQPRKKSVASSPENGMVSPHQRRTS